MYASGFVKCRGGHSKGYARHGRSILTFMLLSSTVLVICFSLDSWFLPEKHQLRERGHNVRISNVLLVLLLVLVLTCFGACYHQARFDFAPFF